MRAEVPADRDPDARTGTLPNVFVPFACAYFFSFLLRNINAVVFPELVSDFALGPDALGLLSGAYFFGFAASQIPLGLLLDRYGPRRVNSVMLCVAAAGVFSFASATNLTQLILARTMMGVGFAGGLMSAMTAFVLWFERRRMATLGGWMLAVGSIGAVAATVPVEWALRSVSWRMLFTILGFAVIATAALILRIVPERSSRPSRTTWHDQWQALVTIYADREFWRIGLLAALTQGAALALLGLWAGPWMRDIAGLERAAIAWHLSAAALCFGLGGIVFGTLSDRLTARGFRPELSFLAGCYGTVLALVPLAACLPHWPLVTWCAFIGFAASGALAFALLTPRFPEAMAGRVLTGVNVLVMACAFGYQAGVGAVIGFWPIENGAYAVTGYQAALSLALALQLGASLWACRTACRRG